MSEVEFELPENPLSTGQDAPDQHPPLESELVTHWKIACSGDEARGMGHPKVWMQISPFTGYVDCAYCDKRFIIDRDNAHDDH
ncbi:MAG: zinc-finger domain-containing protein [Paracoccus sp. (in: a-proteobacteria)]